MGIGPKILAWGGLAVFLGIIVIFALPSYRHGEASIAGKRAEDFALQLNGKPTHLSDLHGKVVVLNLWGTWCPPCIEETPALNRLQKYIGSRLISWPRPRSPTKLPSRTCTFPRTVTTDGRPSIGTPSKPE